MAYVSDTGTPGMYKYEPWYYRVSWGGIFAGTLVALGVQLLLMLLGMGIGFGIISPAEGFEGVGVGTGIYVLLATLVSLFVGGWVACRISGITDKLKSGLHGLVVWALFTFTAFYLMTTAAGGLISSFAGIIGRSAAIAAGELPGVTPEMTQAALDAVSRTSLWAFFALILSAVAAVLGGWVGRSKEVTTIGAAAAEERERGRRAA
ncbi:hypothetical protein KJ039_10190 [bacterium]|nr:hypothetical protein [bacterium]